jgi:hypothetical protein
MKTTAIKIDQPAKKLICGCFIIHAKRSLMSGADECNEHGSNFIMKISLTLNIETPCLTHDPT